MIRAYRLWFPLVVVALSTVGMIVVRSQPEMERNHQAWVVAGLWMLAGSLTLLWFVFLSRLRWRTRGLGVLALVVAGVGLSRLVRIDGSVDGRGLPKFAWRWQVRHPMLVDPRVGEGSVASVATVDGLKDVPQFFGPLRDGTIRDAGLTRDWTANPPKERWRQPIGSGWSAFAVVDGRAYTQEQREEKETVTCYEVATGRLLWIHAYPAHFTQWQGGEGPRATPTVDRGCVFAYGGTGVLSCLNTEGKIIWSRNVLEENGIQNLEWGASSSPLVYGDLVVVTGGSTVGPTLLAYDRATGELRWKGGTDKASYASPILATLAGRKVVLSVNSGTVTAHDPATGAVLLDFAWAGDKWPKASQPVVLPGDRVFLSAGYGMGATMLEVKAAEGGKLAATMLWKSVRMKTQFNSVAARDGYLYGLDDGLLACVDAATGERKWKDGRFGSGQTLLVDDLVLVQSEAGPAVLAAARPEGYQELGRIPALSSKTWNHPTLAGRFLILRNDREAVCYEIASAK